MKVVLEQSKCTGHARCHATGPNLFPIDEQGYSTLVSHVVARYDEPAVLEGVAACPELALRIEEA
ncbi:MULTISPECIES: ferredoxin [unclassified Mycobacterium]|uniref:ferredoxin n=1 Tax=unclassified Mycobacterium TaxID=2642494 RepID=UPI0029C69EAF|nr:MULTISPECIES: ferredoxin [unclassified Mycobacterium]